jgi:hypothetical protein
VINTNVFLPCGKGKRSDLFTDLIEGCFTGYERIEPERIEYRKKLFELSNNVVVHCDPDFAPLTPEKIVRCLVQSLAKNKYGTIQAFTPLHAPLRSHESKPIQVADIIVGAIAYKIKKSEPLKPLLPHNFDIRKIRHSGREKLAKVYRWPS